MSEVNVGVPNMLEALKKEVCDANIALPKYGLALFTWGNANTRGNTTIMVPGSDRCMTVGAWGVVPPSENALVRISQGADGYCGGPKPPVSPAGGKPPHAPDRCRLMIQGAYM